MKIKIKTSHNNLNLSFPTKLLFGRNAVRIINTIGRQYAVDVLDKIPPDALETMCAQLRQTKERYGTWDLVDIETADGKIVKIIL